MNLNEIIEKLQQGIPDHITGLTRLIELGKRLSSLQHPQLQIFHNYFREILLKMRQVQASDIEIGGANTHESIWMRIYGSKKVISEFGAWPIYKSDIFCLALLNTQQLKRLYQNNSVDFSYSMVDGDNQYRWRATMYLDLGHVAFNLRAINDKIMPFQNLGFHPNVARALSLKHEKQGIVLLTGITGSGKSTTMDSIIDLNNQIMDAHIVVIGDPIEYIHKSKKCIIRHREVGKDVKSFKDGVVQALRQDPDIIVVGEMRDSETIMSCLEISDTGHKVFSTLHTGSSVETIDRIVAETPPEEQERVRVRLADQLRVVVSQKLVPSIDGKRLLAKEVLLVSSSIRAAIRNKNTHEIYQMISEGGKQGLVTLEQDLARLYIERRIEEQTALDFANNKNRIKELLTSYKG